MDSREWTTADLAYLDAAYRNGIRPSEIGARLGRTTQAIWTRASMLKITRPTRRFTPHQQSVIHQAAESGWTMDEVIAVVGGQRQAVRKFCQRRGLVLARPAYHRKNEALFDTPTPQSAYLAGWIASDGYISPGGRSVTIKIKRRDGYVLEHLAKLSDYGGTVTYGSMAIGYAVLRFGSTQRWCEALTTWYGIKPNKTFHLPAPADALPAEARLAYLVGLIEGDGSIREYGTILYLRFASASKPIAYWLADMLGRLAERKCSVYEIERTNSKTSNPLATSYQPCLTGRYAARAAAGLMTIRMHHLRRKWHTAEAAFLRYAGDPLVTRYR